jgi:hypothetical protein
MDCLLGLIGKRFTRFNRLSKLLTGKVDNFQFSELQIVKRCLSGDVRVVCFNGNHYQEYQSKLMSN